MFLCVQATNDDACVPDLTPVRDDIAIVPSVDTPLVTVSRECDTRRHQACIASCHSDCHVKLIDAVVYFIDIELCEECIANIEKACSQCQLAHRIKQDLVESA